MTECYECGRSLGLVPDDEIETARESLGFGAANDQLRSFCSVPVQGALVGYDGADARDTAGDARTVPRRRRAR